MEVRIWERFTWNRFSWVRRHPAGFVRGADDIVLDRDGFPDATAANCPLPLGMLGFYYLLDCATGAIASRDAGAPRKSASSLEIIYD